MTDRQTVSVSVDKRIENFIAKKALQYPKLGLAIMHPKVVESALRPFHEVLAEQIIERHGNGFLLRLSALVKSYPLTAYGRTGYVK